MDALLPSPRNAGGKNDLTAPPPPIKGQACNTSGESYVTARWRNPITVFIQTITVRTKILQLYLSIILQHAQGEQRSELGGLAWTPTCLDTTSDGAPSSASVASDLHPAPPSRYGRRCYEWLKTPPWQGACWTHFLYDMFFATCSFINRNSYNWERLSPVPVMFNLSFDSKAYLIWDVIKVWAQVFCLVNPSGSKVGGKELWDPAQLFICLHRSSTWGIWSCVSLFPEEPVWHTRFLHYLTSSAF